MHTSLDSIVNLSDNWSIYSLFLEFWPKTDFGQVRCGCLIESNKHFGNNFTGCWLGYGGGCLMQRQYIVKIIGNVSDWLSYAGGALIKVADSAGSTVTSMQQPGTGAITTRIPPKKLKQSV